MAGDALPETLPPATRDRIERLMAYVGELVEQPVAYVGQAPGNSHEGWVLRAGDQGGRTFVARLDPDEGPFLHYDGDREALLLGRLADQGIPVPRVLAVGDRELVGSPFVVLEWIDGEVLNPRAAQALAPAERELRARAMVSMLARLHAAPWEQLLDGGGQVGAGLAGTLAQFERSLAQLRVVSAPVLDFVRVWIERNAPRGGVRPSVVHGDFRLGNVVWDGNRIAGVLDWETASVGDPVFDVAWMCMGATEGSAPIMGLVSRDTFVQLYAEASGREVGAAELVFWQVVAAWVRGCTEARLLDVSLVSHAPSERDARDLSWEFGSARTEAELFELIGAFDGLR